MRRVGTSMIAVIAALSAGLAAATIRLLLTDPVSVAGALDQGDVALVTQALADAVAAAVRTLMRWL